MAWDLDETYTSATFRRAQSEPVKVQWTPVGVPRSEDSLLLCTWGRGESQLNSSKRKSRYNRRATIARPASQNAGKRDAATQASNKHRTQAGAVRTAQGPCSEAMCMQFAMFGTPHGVSGTGLFLGLSRKVLFISGKGFDGWKNLS